MIIQAFPMINSLASAEPANGQSYGYSSLRSAVLDEVLLEQVQLTCSVFLRSAEDPCVLLRIFAQRRGPVRPPATICIQRSPMIIFQSSFLFSQHADEPKIKNDIAHVGCLDVCCWVEKNTVKMGA